MSSIAERMFNVDALATAIRAFATPQQAEQIEYLYVLLDDSMKKAYEAGVCDAKARAEGEAEIDRDDAWDHGYLDGVSDARARPAKADDTVQDILNDFAQFALNGQFEAEYPAEFDEATEGDAKFNAHVQGADWDLDNKGYTSGPVEWIDGEPYPTYEG